MRKTFRVVGVVILAALAVLLAVMITPSLLEPRRRSNDRSNLRMVGLGLVLYGSQHEGRFPPGLHTLAEEGHIDSPRRLVSPGDSNPPSIGPQGFPCSYEYPGPLPVRVHRGIAVAYTRRGVFPDGRNVLFADGSVRFVRESHFSRGWTGRVSLQDAYNWLMERKEYLPENADLDRIADFYGMSRP